MKKSIAFVFSNSPYGKYISCEGINIILSLAIGIKNIGIFFIEDGILQLLKSQKPEIFFLNNYVFLFKILPTFNICNFFFCLQSSQERGIYNDKNFIIKGSFLKENEIKEKIHQFDIIFKW
ncbi:sulfurtransferase complex subunit TusC [Buchnera aphidicola]|uniref:sulfurtransferase complex subunit TusC n=1 Tax=Buchnera aphidicola TaxID=9 RepID=UPI0031B68A5C